MVMKQCMKCRTTNPDRALFCQKCGAPLRYSQYGRMTVNGDLSPDVTSTASAPPAMNIGFSDAIRICMKEKYLCFKGRANRAEYWYFVLFSLIVSFFVAFVGGILGTVFSGGDEEVGLGLAFILIMIVSLGLICPGLSVLVRRLHDTGRSGWWYFVCFIPWIGSIVLLVFMCLGSQEYDNKYGPCIK